MADSIDDLLADRRRGSVAIALDAARLLAELAPDRRPGAAARLVRAHPAMAPLRLLARAADPVQFAANLRRHLDDASDRGAALVKGKRVLTISWSGVVEQALRRGQPSQVDCLRSEPGGEGAEMAARLGGRIREDADLAGAVATSDLGLTGADAVGPDSFVNKVGTAALCRALPTVLLDIPEKRLDAVAFAECAAAAGEVFECVPLDLVSYSPVSG